MKRVCSYCNEIIGYKITSDNSKESVTHGICSDCFVWMKNNINQSMKDYLNGFNFPVILVNSDAIIMEANRFAMEFLQKTKEEIIGYHGGDSLECEFARRSEGCGKTIHCEACTLRNSIIQTHNSGISLEKIPAYQRVYSNNEVEKISLTISTEKIENYVLVKIEDHRDALLNE